MIVRNIGDEFEIERGEYIYRLKVVRAIALADVDYDCAAYFAPYTPDPDSNDCGNDGRCNGCFFYDSDHSCCTMTEKEYKIVGNCYWYIDTGEDPVYDEQYSADGNLITNESDVECYSKRGIAFAYVSRRKKKTPLPDGLEELCKAIAVALCAKK